MAAPRDVDQLWAQLKQQGAAPSTRRSNPLSGFAGIPGVTSRVRTYDKSKGPPQPVARSSFIQQLGEGARAGAGDGQQQAAAGDHQALLASLQRDINGLSDPDRSVRRRAVEKLHAALLGSSGGVAPEALQAVVAGPLLVPLVRLLADPAEKCRELAVNFFAVALAVLPQLDAVLPVLVPAIAERVGTPPVQEPSEELRLSLAELVAKPLLARAPRPLPGDLLPPLCAILCSQLQDPYADIKKAACTSLAHLAAAVPTGALPPSLQQPLVLALTDNLVHQHSRVRLASLQALHALVQHGMPQALMEEAVLPAVRPLAADHALNVRATLFSCVAQWAGSHLPADGSSGSGDEEGRATNQCRAFVPLLLPLLLLGLTDDGEAVRSDTFEQLEAVGARLASQAGSGREAPTSMAVDQSSQQPLPGYCHPFSTARPSPAACCLVQSQLSRLLKQSLAELREWTATLRVSATRLLRATLIYSGAEVLPQLPTLVLALRTAVADDDAGVATHAVGCVHVLGVNLPAHHWVPLAAEMVAAEQQPAGQKTAALVVLSALLYAAAQAGSAVDGRCLQLAAATLSSPQLAAAAAAPDGGPTHQQLLPACSNLVRWAGAASAAVASQLFQVLLHLWALEADSQPGAAAAKVSAVVGDTSLTSAAVLQQLAAALGASSAADLCDRYGPDLLHRCLQGHEQWTRDHPDWRTLSALLRLCSSAALLPLWPQALPALQLVAADHERDPLLRLELLQLLAALLDDDAKGEAWQQAGTGQSLVHAVLLPALVWRAGRVPAAARFAALTALATLLSKQRLPAAQLRELLVPSTLEGTAAVPAEAAADTAAPGTDGAAGQHGGIQAGDGLLARVAGCLDEDYEPDTRHLACHVLHLLLDSAGPQLPSDLLAPLQQDLLRRLDDSSNRVRVTAFGALRSWLASVAAPPGAPSNAGLSDAVAASLASSLLIHLDDPDAEVAGAACSTLEQLAAARPAALCPLAEAATVQPSRREHLGRVLAACEGTS